MLSGQGRGVTGFRSAQSSKNEKARCEQRCNYSNTLKTTHFSAEMFEGRAQRDTIDATKGNVVSLIHH